MLDVSSLPLVLFCFVLRTWSRVVPSILKYMSSIIVLCRCGIGWQSGINPEQQNVYLEERRTEGPNSVRCMRDLRASLDSACSCFICKALARILVVVHWLKNGEAIV